MLIPLNSKQIEDVGDISEVNVAVLGTFGVGKSTFVQCALDLKQSPSSPISSKKVSLEGVLIRIRLLEVQLSDVKISDNQRVEWPQRLGEENTPRIDGALALYDVMDHGSTIRIPEVLSESHSFNKLSLLFWRPSLVHVTCLGCHWLSTTLSYRSIGLTFSSGLDAFSKCAMPWVLVSNKCDIPPNARQINPQAFEQICNAFGETQSFHTSFNAPETHKRCISAILRTFMPDPSGKSIFDTLSTNLIIWLFVC